MKNDTMFSVRTISTLWIQLITQNVTSVPRRKNIILVSCCTHFLWTIPTQLQPCSHCSHIILATMQSHYSQEYRLDRLEDPTKICDFLSMVIDVVCFVHSYRPLVGRIHRVSCASLYLFYSGHPSSFSKREKKRKNVWSVPYTWQRRDRESVWVSVHCWRY